MERLFSCLEQACFRLAGVAFLVAVLGLTGCRGRTVNTDCPCQNGRAVPGQAVPIVCPVGPGSATNGRCNPGPGGVVTHGQKCDAFSRRACACRIAAGNVDGTVCECNSI